MPRLSTVGFAAVLLVWLAARVVYFNGYYTEDAPGYVSDAIAIALGQYEPRHHVNGLNIGTYAPVAIPLLVLGKTDAALSVWPLLCSLLGVLSIAGLCAVLFGRGFGVIAAFLYATHPGDIFFSTVVMPDAIQSGWLSLSMLLVVLGCLRTAAQSTRLLIAAGVAMGACHLIRANGVLLVPVGVAGIALLSLTRARESIPRTVERVLAFTAGWLTVFVVEGLAYRATVGDFLFRFHVVDRHYGATASIAQWGLNTHPLTIPYSTLPPLTWWRFGGWGVFNPDQAYHGLLFLWAGLAVVVAVGVVAGRRRSPHDREAVFLSVAAVWLLWPLLYHQFGSQSLTQFVPIHRLSRHLVVYAPGAIVVLAAGCAIVWRQAHWRTARAALAVLGVALLLLHLQLNVRAESIAFAGFHRIKDTYARIRDYLPSDTRRIIADPGDLGFFDFWLNPLGEERVQLHAFANYATCDALVDGVVLTYSNPGWEQLAARAIQETVARLPCLVQPPANWRLLSDRYPERVFVIE
jgi:4-amino-4-deoxy-L-arabinose transferase-like glycosyltransferase